MGRTLVVWASRAIRSAPPRAACIGISQQWRAYLTGGHSVSPAQVTSFKVKEKKPDCIGSDRFGLATASGMTSGRCTTRDVRCWHKADIDVDDEYVCFWGKADIANGRRRFSKPARRDHGAWNDWLFRLFPGVGNASAGGVHGH